MKNMKILMVCTGNICRSPMAEGIARTLLKAAKRDDISVDSAATHAYHTGDAPDPRARRTMRAHHMPIDDLRARPFIAEDFAAFDARSPAGKPGGGVARPLLRRGRRF